MTEADRQEEPTVDAEGDSVSAEIMPIVRACSLFLDKVQNCRAELLDVIHKGMAAHNRELSRMQSMLEETGAQDPDVVWAHIEAVKDTTIDPINQALRKLEPVATAAAAWDEASADIRDGLGQLSTKDRLQISPHALFVEGIANCIAALEFGVGVWLNEALDAADAMHAKVVDVDNTAVEPDPHGTNLGDTDLPTEPVVEDRFVAAANTLGQHLQAAFDRLDSLNDEVLPAVEAAASGKSSSVEKALQMPAAEMPTESLVAADLGDWAPWFDQVESRMTVSSARITLFRAALSMRDVFAQRVLEGSLAEWFSTIQVAAGAMGEAREAAVALFDELQDSGDLREATLGLVNLLRSSTQLLDAETSTKLDIDSTLVSIDDVARDTISELVATVQTLPGLLIVHATNPAADGAAKASTREIDLHSVATDVVEEFLVPVSTSWSERLHERLQAVVAEADNLLPVLRFYVGGAIEELRDVSGKRTPTDVRDDGQAAAHELTVSGLDRAVEVLAKLESDLLAAVTESAAAIADARHTFWVNVNAQVVAESVQAKLALQLESRADSAQQAFRVKVQDIASRCFTYVSQSAVRLYRKSGELLSYGRAAITGDAVPDNYETTVNALAAINAIRGRLPVVYRRLFSFHPLNDDSLMAGRDEDIKWLNQQLKTRRRGRPSAIVITGSPGCGVTTFINAAKQSCLRHTRFKNLDLISRIDNESDLVKKLVTILELGDIGTDNLTLSALADRIMADEEQDKMLVCVVERIEHLFLRKIAGFELIAGLLRFMSETASRVFWIATTTEFAWQLLARNEPTARGLISHYRISGYGRSELEEVIDQRHRRSALDISFDPPADVSPIMERRVRNAQNEEDVQAIYRAAYFDSLFTASGQNIMIAIFYWLLSVRYRSDPPAISVKALPELNFDSLANLSVTELFALKAFLEHGSLTVLEYCQISTVDENVGFEIFESLGNAMLVERARDEEAGIMDLEFERIERGGRYRVRPLLAQPIIRGLRAKNIVH